MQEQKKYKIESVLHNYISALVHKCIIVDYYREQDVSLQLNFTSEHFAISEKTDNTVGMWRIKQQKLNH